MVWTTIRIHSNTRKIIEQFRLVDNEIIDDILVRTFNSIDRKELLNKIKNQLEKRVFATCEKCGGSSFNYDMGTNKTDCLACSELAERLEKKKKGEDSDEEMRMRKNNR